MKTCTYLLTVLLLLGTGLHAQQPTVDDPVLTRKINALRAVWQDVESNPVGSDKRKEYLREFMDKSAPVLAAMGDKHPGAGGMWTLRALAAYELNLPRDAWQAAKRMTALGLDKSNNDLVQKVYGLMERKGWLENAQYEREEKLWIEAQAAAKQQGDAEQKKAARQAVVELLKLDPGNADASKLVETLDADVIAAIKGKSFTNSIGMEMVWLDDTAGFWAGKYEVTQAEYEKVVGSNPAGFKGARRPVENVSWHDATDFCAKLTATEIAAGKLPIGYRYALPTEHQWQYAAADATIKQAIWKRDANKGTADVGTLKPNKFGLHDMLGNVREWCQDWYDNEQNYRVLRGGSWGNTDPDRVSVSFRGIGTPESRDDYCGFRCVLVGGGAFSSR